MILSSRHTVQPDKGFQWQGQDSSIFLIMWHQLLPSPAGYLLEYGHKPIMTSQFDQDKHRKLHALQMQPYLNYDNS